MRKTDSSILRKIIPQKFFSTFISCHRLRRIQSKLLPRGKGCDGKPEAVLAILGIDSRYNEGCRQLADFLFFGFFTLRQQELEKDGVEDEDVEDVILLVTHDSVHVYCSMALYEYLLPYVIHLPNLCIYSMNAVSEDDRDRDGEEEYKIKSFISMVEGCKHIGIPYLASSGDKIGTDEKMLLEKWPLVQSYASEEFGKGSFFTMMHNVFSYHAQLFELFNDCDAVVLEKMISTSLPLFQRHWIESVNIVDGAAKAGKLLHLSERQIIEPIICYFNHGRLMANRHMHKKLSNAAINSPYVIFGARTQEFSSNPSSNENVVIKDASTHMIFHCKAPKGPLVCSRTYFIKNKEASAVTKRNQEELCKLYKHCVEAACLAVKTYAATLSSAMGCADASTHLLKARTTLTFKPDCSINAFDKLGRKVPLVDGQSTGHLKTIKISASDICDSKQCIGAVLFEDTFVVSSIDVGGDDATQRDFSSYVLTSSVPTSLQWMLPSALTEKKCDCDVIIEGVACWSNSSLFCESQEVALKLSTSGNLFVTDDRFGIVDVTKAENLFYYDGSSPGKVGVFIVNFGRSSASLNLVPEHLHSSIKIRSNDAKSTNSCLIFYFQPGSASYKAFTTKVVYKSDEQIKIEVLASVSNELKQVHQQIQSITNQQKLSTMEEIDFLKHFKVSSIVSGHKVSSDAANILLDKPSQLPDQQGKICVTVLMGLPCSRVVELCNSLVSVNKEHVRWVVIKAQNIDNNSCGTLDRAQLEDQLTQVVSKRKVTRPSAAARKKLRIILLAVGFFEVCEVVGCVTSHLNDGTRDAMFVGAVTTCVSPTSLMLDERRFVPRLLDQCTVGFVNNIVFSITQNTAFNKKDKDLETAQSLLRAVNPAAAHIISTNGQLSRQNDFMFVLNESTFNSEKEIGRRQLIKPNVVTVPRTLYPRINRVHLEFSLPLMKGSLNAHLRSLKLKLSSMPYTGNVYFVTGCLTFTDDPSQHFDLAFSSLDGAIELTPHVMQTQQPAPPPSNKEQNSNKKQDFHITFYGVSIDRKKMMDWIRETGRQRPSKKCIKTKSHLTHNEINAIKEEYKSAPLPEGYFYNGTQYVNLMNDRKTYEHPCMDRFIEEYLHDKNQEIDAYNTKLASEGFVDLFA